MVIIEQRTEPVPTVKKTNAHVEVINHKDVRGKELLYLKLSVGEKEVVINVGKATYEGVQELLVPRETSTKIQVLEPKKP